MSREAVPRWQVEALYNGNNRRLFEDVLRAFDVSVVYADANTYLMSPAFDACIDAGSASDLAQKIADAVRLTERGPDVGFAVGSRVLEHRADGSQYEHHVMRARSVEFRIVESGNTMLCVAYSGTPDEIESARERQREAEYQVGLQRVSAHARAAFKSTDGTKIITLLKAPRLDTTTMNQIAELIRADLGKEGLALLKVSSDLDRFFGSINHPEIFGDKARHAARNEKPHPKPMNESEAETFIRDLADKWTRVVADR